jgi:hypothetical protein
MKKLIGVLAMMLHAYMMFSQNGDADKFKVSFGANYEMPRKYYDNGFLSSEEDGIIQVSLLGKEMALQKFDPVNLKMTNDLRLDISKIPKNFRVELYRSENQQHLLFYSAWNKSTSKEQLFVQEIDVKVGALVGESRLLIECDEIAESYSKFRFNFSGDKSHMVINYQLKPKIKSDAVSKEVVGFYVFDEKLQKLWSREITMPQVEKLLDVKDYDVDRYGNAYLLAKVYKDERKEMVDDKPNYNYQLFMANAEEKNFESIELKLEDKFINEIYIYDDKSGNLLLAGFYRNMVKSLGTEGAFIFKIDENGKASSFRNGIYPFPLEILKQYEKKAEQEKLEKADKKDKTEAEAFQVDFHSIPIFDDNSLLIIGEQFYKKSRTYYSNGSPYTETTYYYGDIYVMKINSDGELAWTRKIPKQQQGGRGRGGMSFKYMHHKGNNYFIYLDHIKNLELADDQPAAVHMDGVGGYLTVCKIDNEGNFTKGKLLDQKKENIIIQPANFEKLSPTTLFLKSQVGTQNKILRIELTE